MSDDFYFKVSVYDGEFRDILFEVNDEVSHFPDNIIDMKNDIEKLLKTLGILFRNDLSSYDYYYDRIFLLADLAFNGKRDQTSLVKSSLESIKNEIVHDVGPKLRTELLFRYIKISSAPLFLMSCFFIGIYNFEDSEVLNYVSKLILVAIGANVGCWLSLAVRTRGIEYSQILPVLSDSRGVISRIIFVMAFSIVLAILMKSGLLSIKLGEFSSAAIETKNYSALSAGLIMGFAEQLFVDKFQNKIKTIKL